MTQATRLILLLREGPKTLSQILAAPGLAAEYRRTMTDLRHEGYDIQHHRARNCKAPACKAGSWCPAKLMGENCYRLEAEPPKVEANGQMVLAV